MNNIDGKNVCAQTPTVNLLHIPHDFDGPEQPLLVRLDIYAEAILRTTYEDDQPVATDELHPRDVAAALAGLETGTGLLPKGTLFHRQAGPDCAMAIYLPPGRRTLRIEGRGDYDIPCPACIFAGQGTEYKIYALADASWPGRGTTLYNAPFPNVHKSGQICRGDVKFPRCSPERVHAAAQLFFESQFNLHLRNNKSQAHANNVLAAWRELIETRAESYPIEDLIESQVTLDHLLRR